LGENKGRKEGEKTFGDKAQKEGQKNYKLILLCVTILMGNKTPKEGENLWR
jgi:hypothetical protein